MHDDTVTTSWKRSTDAAPPGKPTVAPAAMPHADLMRLKEGAAPSPSPAHTASAAAGCRMDRDREAIREAVRLATWEDEGGMSSS